MSNTISNQPGVLRPSLQARDVRRVWLHSSILGGLRSATYQEWFVRLKGIIMDKNWKQISEVNSGSQRSKRIKVQKAWWPRASWEKDPSISAPQLGQDAGEEGREPASGPGTADCPASSGGRGANPPTRRPKKWLRSFLQWPRQETALPRSIAIAPLITWSGLRPSFWA